MLMRCVAFVGMFALASTSLTIPAAPAADTATKADTPRTTSAGTQFVQPADWTMHAAGNKVTLAPPEAGSQAVLVDVKATTPDDAVTQAWKAYAPAKTWPLQVATDVAPRDDWDQVRVYNYETSANDKRGVTVIAYRHGDQYTVLIYDMANAVAEKRASQLRAISDRLLPKGYKRESFAGKKAHPLDAARVETLKAFVDGARKAYDVPGVAIGLIDHGKVVFAGGLGVREINKPTPVDADTLFMIASNTKALTTLMLAREVDQKKFTWNTPVVDVMPSFRLGDAATTKQVLMRHLICACTGMPRQDMEWLLNSRDATPETVMKALSGMQPTSKFGELFQYSNLMAAAAGYIGAHALYPNMELGAAYDLAMQKQVFDPLGMKITTFDYDRALLGNHATPHGLDVDGHTAIAGMGINDSVRAARPAGAAWSAVSDMLRYVQMELDDGLLPDGQRYVSRQSLLERRKANVALGTTATYGMGLMVDHTWGVPVVHHGGDLTGFHSDMMWLPEQGVGAVILTNADAGVFIRGPFQRRLLEVLFDGKPLAQGDIDAGVKRLKAQIAAERKRLTVPADPAEVAKLADNYRNPAVGSIQVDRSGKNLEFNFGAWHSEVASRKNDDGSVSFVTISPGSDGFEFVVSGSGDNRKLVLRDDQHEYVYDEVK
ncbi:MULTISPECIES: serine hydrolase domain-containing protein [unclassified Dyella]|uniref:serine hydrolase domain-containing protein n=1 Tax=unclassified Dyella TaxID=2634549 RepID=UPI000CB5A363|nr:MULTISPECIES: serine hydrolase domain-containing protein [unclassified Dyella]MDR3447077.1 serine hydrolase [Dyella sp.]PMQ04866.1 Beta-lactamase [Dyella sp. AD56]